MDRRSWVRRGDALALLAFSAALVALTPTALANTYTPNKLGDHAPNGCSPSDCTLREAVIKANAHAGSDRIFLRAGKTYKLAQAGTAENAAAKGDLDIKGSLKILSRSKTRPSKVDGRGIDRVFEVGPVHAANAAFKLLRIKGGNSDDGGGVQADAGITKIVKSTISGNTTSGFGGGLNLIGGDGVLRQSTVSGNSAKHAGGIAVQGATASLRAINSTIANNRATGTGGGIDVFSSANANLRSITVVRNHANRGMGGQDGGGLFNSGSTTVRNSVVALNTVNPAGGGTGPDCFGPFTSAGVNLISFLDPDCTGFAVPPNILASNPKLGSLRNNGGPTKTVALRKHSPAINHAGSGSPKRDQRSVKRKNPDIGAFERK